MTDLVIQVHTFQATGQLRRLLCSIAKHQELRQHPVLIVDDSLAPRARAENLAVVGELGALQIAYVDQERWGSLRTSLFGSATDDGQELLTRLRLGMPGWNVANARNIGLLLLHALYPGAASLSLDSDMILPASLMVPKSSSCYSFTLEGGVDLSRLEWIGVYLRYLARLLGRRVNEAAWYGTSLLGALSLEELAAVIQSFSRFPVEANALDAPLTLALPCREENHGGCYVLPPELARVIPFPSWYDNDWFFFRTLRQGKRFVRFDEQVVCHASGPKDVLHLDCLCDEERGKILTKLWDFERGTCDYSDSNVESIRASRRGIIERELRLLDSLERDWGDRFPVPFREVRNALDSLSAWLTTLETPQLVSAVIEYQREVRLWPSLFSRSAPE